MKKKFLVIIGSGGHTRAVLSTAKLMRKWNSFRILDIDFKNQKEEIMGVEIESYKNIFSFFEKPPLSVLSFSQDWVLPQFRV